MKKLTTLLVLTIFCCPAIAQDNVLPVKIKPVLNESLSQDIQDIRTDFESMGLYSFTYDLDLDKEYLIAFNIEEYLDGKVVKKFHELANVASYPIFDNGELAGWELITSIRAIVDATADQELYFRFEFPKRSKMSMCAKNENMIDGAFYKLRQFALPDKWTLDKKIPLLAYASAYRDGDFFRFCGTAYPEDLSDELFEKSPHYYIVSITLRAAPPQPE